MGENESPISGAIKATGVPELVKTLRDFAEKLFGPAAEECGELLRDNVRSYRFRNQIRILEKAEAFSAQTKQEIGAVPLRTLVPLLEGASLEDQPMLQDMWAGLLANAAGSSTSSATRPAFVDIMKQLSPPEASILSKWFVNRGFPIPTAWGVKDFNFFGTENMPYNKAELATGITNLLRLGLVSTDKGFASELRELRTGLRRITESLDVRRSGGSRNLISFGWGNILQPSSEYMLTPLGFQFLHSVLPPVTLPIIEPWDENSEIDQLVEWENLTGALSSEFEWKPELATELTASHKRTQDEIIRRENIK